MSELKFADKLNRLEEIARSLEMGECSLEDAISLYEEGKKLANECSDTLRTAKQKIEVIKE
jgi:exodeoxyribonuclease VII small subunit